jgi:hypothetical protein
MTELFSVFEYCIAGIDDALHPEDGLLADSLWNMPLSGKKKDIQDSALLFTIGDYLLSAGKFLEKNNYLFLRKGLTSALSCNVKADEIETIAICLEKHGPFYHPIKISVILKNDKSVFFVLNGAVSDMGLSIIENEYQNLKKLNFDKSNQSTIDLKNFLPIAFGIDFIESDKGKVGFFLAQWFDDFEEFHVVKTDNKNKIGLLKNDGSFSLIPDSISIKIYTKASKILTLYYGIESLKQIFPWHHAAGDFVVKIDNGDVDVKLITVRGLNTLMESEDLFLGLLFFFLNLSLRMRIDRNKGTKEYVFLDESIVQACTNGFIDGLKENLKVNQIFNIENPDFFNLFTKFIKDFDLKVLLNVFIMIIGSYNENAPETPIIKENLEQHAKAVFESIKRL